MVRHRHPAKRLFPILRALPGRGCMDAMRAGVVTVLLALLLLPVATAAGKKPYRIGIVLPGDQWVSGVDGLKEGRQELGSAPGPVESGSVPGDFKVTIFAGDTFMSDD